MLGVLWVTLGVFERPFGCCGVPWGSFGVPGGSWDVPRRLGGDSGIFQDTPGGLLAPFWARFFLGFVF